MMGEMCSQQFEDVSSPSLAKMVPPGLPSLVDLLGTTCHKAAKPTTAATAATDLPESGQAKPFGGYESKMCNKNVEIPKWKSRV